MKLYIRDTFACSPQMYWDSFFDEDLENEMLRRSRVEIENLSEHEEDGLLIRRQRFIFPTRPPAAITRATGIERFEFEQISRIDRPGGQVAWEIIPPRMRDRIQASGVYVVRAHPDGCERVLDGDVVARIPLVGRAIENAVSNSIKRSYDEGTELRRQWFAERLGG